MGNWGPVGQADDCERSNCNLLSSSNRFTMDLLACIEHRTASKHLSQKHKYSYVLGKRYGICSVLSQYKLLVRISSRMK